MLKVRKIDPTLDKTIVLIKVEQTFPNIRIQIQLCYLAKQVNKETNKISLTLQDASASLSFQKSVF